jgi:hypothetical protein
MSDDASQAPEYGRPPTTGMQQFQSVKVIRAGEITELVAAGCYVREADGSAVFREYWPKMTARFKPTVGDFWVVYEGDGYESLSPRAAFVTGYVALDQRQRPDATADDPMLNQAQDAHITPMLNHAQDAHITALAHAMQAGVALVMQLGLSNEAEPKHLRVGVNMAMVEHCALIEVLINKGICSLEQIKAANITALEREVDAYEKQLSDHYGREVKLG